MQKKLEKKLIVAISSRALFDLDESNAVFEKEGIQQYAKYQIAHENEILKPGVAFPLVQKFFNLVNAHGPLVEIVLLSRNSTDTGLRIFNSIQEYNLDITRAAFTNGASPYPYINAFGAHLFLSTNSTDVRNALKAGCAAATILASPLKPEHHPEELRIAFDGDAVLFSDEAESVFQTQGLAAFSESEKKQAKMPLLEGPFKMFLEALQQLQSQFTHNNCPVRTGLFTARSAPAHERVIRTLRSWRIRIDEALFLGGLNKVEFLRAFGADIFFDDQQVHCKSASTYVTTGHVPHGIINV